MRLKPNTTAWRNVSNIMKPGGQLTIYYFDEMFATNDQRADQGISLCTVINQTCDTHFVDLEQDGDEVVVWQKQS